MDPVSVAGLALGVASLGLQVYTGCIQGMNYRFVVTNHWYLEKQAVANIAFWVIQVYSY